MAILIGISIRDSGWEAVAQTTLSPARIQKAGRLAKPEDRLRCLGAGLALDAALRTIGLRERDLHMAYTAHGKPVFPSHPSVHFSLSHSGEWCLCGLDDSPIGVDVQQRRHLDVVSLAQHYFSPEESAMIITLPESQRADTFFRLWTAKESVLKLEGTGLSGSLSSAQVHVGSTLSLVNHTYHLTEYPLEGYYMTVCSVGTPPSTLQILSGGNYYETHCQI